MLTALRRTHGFAKWAKSVGVGLPDEKSTYHARHSVRKLTTEGTGEKLNCDGSRIAAECADKKLDPRRYGIGGWGDAMKFRFVLPRLPSRHITRFAVRSLWSTSAVLYNVQKRTSLGITIQSRYLGV